jgi:hypothetical protein
MLCVLDTKIPQTHPQKMQAEYMYDLYGGQSVSTRLIVYCMRDVQMLMRPIRTALDGPC